MVRRLKQGLPLALAVVVGLGIGRWTHSGSVLAATTAAPAQFQLSGDGSTLSLYYPAERMVFVYPAQSGANNINCAYSFHVNGLGEAIQRENCPIGKLY